MRSLSFDHDGEEIQLAATFDASMEIAEKVADPLQILRQIVAAAQLGPAFQPKFVYTVANVAQILHIGQKAAGGKRTLKDMQKIAFDFGLVTAMSIADQYIALMVAPASDPRKPGKEDPDAGE